MPNKQEMINYLKGHEKVRNVTELPIAGSGQFIYAKSSDRLAKRLFAASFVLLLAIFIVVDEYLLRGNGFYESGSVFFRGAYFDKEFFKTIMILDNGYLSWFAMGLALFVHKILGQVQYFFSVSHLLIGVGMALGCAAFCLPHFSELIKSNLVRFVISIFFGGIFYYAGRYGDFTFLHNGAYALFFFAIILFIQPKWETATLPFILFSALFFLVYVNAKPYCVIFLPLAAFGTIYSAILRNWKNTLFYLLIFPSGLFQLYTIIVNKGSGVSQVTIEGYGFLNGIIDAQFYWLGLYAHFIFYPIKHLNYNALIINLITLSIVFIILYLSFVSIIKTKNYKLFLCMILLNMCAIGSYFMTLYGATGILEYPRFVHTLTEFLRLDQSRQTIIPNICVLLSIYIIVFHFVEKIISNNFQITRESISTLVSIFLIVWIVNSGLFSFNWRVIYNSDYFYEHSVSKWYNDSAVYLKKDEPFLMLSNCDPGVIHCISDLSSGTGWLNNNSKLLEIVSDDIYINFPAREIKQPHLLRGFVLMPDNSENDLFAPKKFGDQAYLTIGKDDVKYRQGHNARLEVTERAGQAPLAILRVQKRSFVNMGTRHLVADPRNLMSIKLANNPRVGTKFDLDIALGLDRFNVLRFYYILLTGIYKISLFDKDGQLLLRKDLNLADFYTRVRAKSLLRAYEFLSSGSLSTVPFGNINWIDIETRELKTRPARAIIEPVSIPNNDNQIVIYQNEEGQLFLRAINEISYAKAYDVAGNLVATARLAPDSLRAVHRYFLFDKPVENAHTIRFFDSHNRPTFHRSKLLYFGNIL